MYRDEISQDIQDKKKINKQKNFLKYFSIKIAQQKYTKLINKE